MTGRIFVDTNILVYAHDRTAGARHEKARDVVLALWDSRAGCLSIQVLQEFYVTVTQKVARPLDRVVATAILRELTAWQVHQPRPVDVLQAIDLQARAQLSFWDAMILQSALQLECAALYTEDLPAVQMVDGLRLVNPLA